MKYMGSKARISKQILPLILGKRKPGQLYVEPFVGGANTIDKVPGPRLGNDFNPYLVAMWKRLTDGWIPPKEISREFYSECREIFKHHKFDVSCLDEDVLALVGYVGFNGSYGGRFYDGGFAGIFQGDSGKIRNYPLEAHKNVIKQIPSLRGVQWKNCDYKDLEFSGSIVYCDPPYRGVKNYSSSSKSDFSHEEFWEWCRTKIEDGNQIFVSEYDAPEDFECIWEKLVSSSLSANGKQGGNKRSTERLFVHKTQATTKKVNRLF